MKGKIVFLLPFAALLTLTKGFAQIKNAYPVYKAGNTYKITTAMNPTDKSQIGSQALFVDRLTRLDSIALSPNCRRVLDHSYYIIVSCLSGAKRTSQCNVYRWEGLNCQGKKDTTYCQSSDYVCNPYGH